MANALKVIAGILALCFWFSSFAVWEYFDSHEPTDADPRSGRIFPLNTHGSVVYLTADEHRLLYGLIYLGAVFFLLTVVSFYLEKIGIVGDREHGSLSGAGVLAILSSR